MPGSPDKKGEGEAEVGQSVVVCVKIRPLEPEATRFVLDVQDGRQVRQQGERQLGVLLFDLFPGHFKSPHKSPH